MRYRTFCVLLASALMAMGTLAGWMKKTEERSAAARTTDASAVMAEEKKGIAPVSGETLSAFGAQYSEELKQWTMNETVRVQIGERKEAVAPISGRVEEIEAQAGGGSRITIACGNVLVGLSPVYGVRVFEGSNLTVGEILGFAEDELLLWAEKEGRYVDPAEVIG